MAVPRKYRKFIAFQLALQFLFAVFIGFASYYHLVLSGWKDHIVYTLHFLILQFTVWGFLYFTTLYRWSFYGIYLPFFTISALFSYWVYMQDIIPTPSVMQVVMETKPDIAVDMVSLPFVLYVAVLILAVIFSVRLFRRTEPVPVLSPLSVLAITGIITFFVVENKQCCTLKRRLPYNIVFSAVKYFEKPDLHLLPVQGVVSSQTEKPDIILVLGESVRADHLQLNAYPRHTNPLLSRRRNLVTFPYLSTPWTYTAVSLPRILSNASVRDTVLDGVVSLYSVVKRLGYSTCWIGNQSPEKSYELFINDNQKSYLIDKWHSSLSFKKFRDEKLLSCFDTVYVTGRENFITLHMIGSHWYYDIRYPDSFRKFKPVTHSKHIPANTPGEMINAYDNTILYLDYFIDKLIKRIDIPGNDVLLLYVSDHGELLGEEGKWLHARESDASTRPAMFVWYSDTFAEKHPGIVQAIKENSPKALTTDFLFHSISDLLKIEGIRYDKTKSIFR